MSGIGASRVIRRPISTRRVPPIGARTVPPIGARPARPLRPPMRPTRGLRSCCGRAIRSHTTIRRCRRTIGSPRGQGRGVSRVGDVFRHDKRGGFSERRIVLSGVQPRSVLRCLALRRHELRYLRGTERDQGRGLLGILRLTTVLTTVMTIITLLGSGPIILIGVLCVLNVMTTV